MKNTHRDTTFIIYFNCNLCRERAKLDSLSTLPKELTKDPRKLFTVLAKAKLDLHTLQIINISFIKENVFVQTFTDNFVVIQKTE